MKDFHPLVAIIICIIVGLILYTVTDNIRNKDKYAACQRDFKSNPYSFTKDRLNDCKFLFYPNSANLTRRQAIEKVLNRK
jgi:hypothetical protein|tara:strand:- start:28 stop:267 length:240 start_codon:yes stop_codon:yes gene_type:complete